MGSIGVMQAVKGLNDPHPRRAKMCRQGFDDRLVIRRRRLSEGLVGLIGDDEQRPPCRLKSQHGVHCSIRQPQV